MVRVSVEVCEGDSLFEVAVNADTISQAVATVRDHFPGHAVRVVFPIDGEEFFREGDAEADGTEYGGRPKLVQGRVV
jgi:hypothetical protein